MNMKYRATITIDFEAFDQPELMRRRQSLCEWLFDFEQGVGPATLTIKERRPRLRPRAPAPHLVWDGSAPTAPGLGGTPRRD
jgi:hypothetical protein